MYKVISKVQYLYVFITLFRRRQLIMCS